jgi:hypothetical protein
MMADNVLDPERAMFRDAERKKLIATKTVEVIRVAFIKDYKKQFGFDPDFKNPVINIYFNAWLSAQGDREWLTAEQKQEQKRKQITNEKRKRTAWQNRDKRKGF